MPIVRTITRFTFFCFFYTIFAAAFAQGSWQPAGADLSFPRTLLRASEISAVQQSMQNGGRNELYQSVYASAIAAPPANNATSPDRRLRARAAKNAAFIRLMNLKPGGSNTLEPLTSAEQTQLETNIITLLESLNYAVETPYSYTEWQWRSKELIDYLIAYDLLRGAGVPVSSLQGSQARLQRFSGKLFTQANTTVPFVGTLLNNFKNNHLFMTAAALGMAGVVLNDAVSDTVANQPQTWINAGTYAIDNVMWRDAARQSDSTAVAGYAEGPYYLKYAFLNCLPFFRTFGNFLPDGYYSFTWNSQRHSIRNPYFDPKYDLLYQWITSITMPDGRLPALEDSYIDMAMPELALTGKAQYLKDFYPQNLEPAQLNTLNAQLDGTVDMRANYLAANIAAQAPADPALTNLPVSGNLIFRSGTGSGSNYLHVYGKNGKMLSNSGGHNHGDAGSFSLYAFGQLLGLDAGYINYDRRAEVGNATNHNLVLVDGAGPLIGTTSTLGSNSNDAEAFIQHTFETPALNYGEVKTAYNGSNITRKTLSIRGEYYLMADFISAAAAHNFTWQLHAYGLANGTAGQGTFTDNRTNNEGIWQKNGVSLKATVTANGGVSAIDTATNVNELTYNQTQKHTTFLARKDNVLQTQFLAALTPYQQAFSSTSTLSQTGVAGLINTTDAFTDLAFTQTDTVLQTVTAPTLEFPVKADANFTFYSVDKTSGAISQVFLQNGTTLFSGTEQVLKSNKRADIVWQQSSTGEINGYVSTAATIVVKAEKQPENITGANLTSWTYDAATQTLQATFSQPSGFQYKISQNPLPVELVAFKAEKVTDKVKLSWQTASETNSFRFNIQRSANAKAWETIGTKPAQGTKNTATAYEYLDAPYFSGPIYYRLQQQDLDGSFRYSAVEKIFPDKAGELQVQLFPNPAGATLTLKLGNAETATAQIRILNLAGAEVYKTNNLPAKNGTEFCLKVAELPAGFYLISYQTETQSWQGKFLKQ